MRKPRFTRQITNQIKPLIHRQVEKNLSGLSPSERAEILDNMLVQQNPEASSLRVVFPSQTAIAKELGTQISPAYPWVKNLQRDIAMPIKSVMALMLKLKK